MDAAARLTGDRTERMIVAMRVRMLLLYLIGRRDGIREIATSRQTIWIGLVFAAAFIVAAIRLRRYRGPL